MVVHYPLYRCFFSYTTPVSTAFGMNSDHQTGLPFKQIERVTLSNQTGLCYESHNASGNCISISLLLLIKIFYPVHVQFSRKSQSLHFGILEIQNLYITLKLNCEIVQFIKKDALTRTYNKASRILQKRSKGSCATR